MDIKNQPVRFEIAGLDGEDPLGVWAPAPERLVHFGVEDEAQGQPADILKYTIELPGDGMATGAALSERESRLARSAQALERIPDRLENLITRTRQELEVVERQEIHFALEEPGVARDLAEAELLYNLAALDAKVAVAPSESEQIDFGVLDEVIHPAMEQAKSQFKSLLDQVQKEVLHYAWVETIFLGQKLACTGVDWSGDSETIWVDGISPEQTNLHKRALRVATRSRALKLRLAITITGGAVKVAALMTNPAGALLALPAVYRYVKQMLEQASELNVLKEGVPNPLV
jgi:hypothetical protein